MNTLYSFSNGERHFGSGFSVVNTTVMVTVKSLFVQFKLVTLKPHFPNNFFAHTTQI